jgi:hypothetical protein
LGLELDISSNGAVSALRDGWKAPLAARAYAAVHLVLEAVAYARGAHPNA